MADIAKNKLQTKVGIIMGSANDMQKVAPAFAVLDKLGISYLVNILSAHRNPKEVAEFATSARDKGIAVIIACAGKSAALPGVIAAHTTLPVVGLPISSKNNINDMAALYSMTEMPPNVPVLSVGLDGAENAALGAARIMSVNNIEITQKLTSYMSEKAAQLIKQNDELQKIGPQAFLKKLGDK